MAKASSNSAEKLDKQSAYQPSKTDDTLKDMFDRLAEDRDQLRAERTKLRGAIEQCIELLNEALEPIPATIEEFDYAQEPERNPLCPKDRGSHEQGVLQRD